MPVLFIYFFASELKFGKEISEPSSYSLVVLEAILQDQNVIKSKIPDFPTITGLSNFFLDHKSTQMDFTYRASFVIRLRIKRLGISSAVDPSALTNHSNIYHLFAVDLSSNEDRITTMIAIPASDNQKFQKSNDYVSLTPKSRFIVLVFFLEFFLK